MREPDAGREAAATPLAGVARSAQRAVVARPRAAEFQRLRAAHARTVVEFERRSAQWWRTVPDHAP